MGCLEVMGVWVFWGVLGVLECFRGLGEFGGLVFGGLGVFGCFGVLGVFWGCLGVF